MLNQLLKRRDKLKLRALIGHLVSYDLINIFRIQLPTKDQVIRIRDVVFDTERFYEGLQGYAEEAVIEEVIELLAFPETLEEDDISITNLLIKRQLRAINTPIPPVQLLEELQEGGRK